MIRDVLRSLKKRWLAALGREVFLRREIRPVTEFHGTTYGGWSILADSLGPSSLVVSVGVGKDASFDLSLIQRYGCIVHAYDPTAFATRWVAENVHDPRFVLHPFALAAADGVLELFPPRNPEGDSASCVLHPHASSASVMVPARTLASVLRELAFAQVDVLKLDIEGAEYGVLEQALADGSLARVRQLLVEFHHLFPSLGVAATHRALAALHAAGWRIAWVAPSHHEVLFLRD